MLGLGFGFGVWDRFFFEAGEDGHVKEQESFALSCAWELAESDLVVQKGAAKLDLLKVPMWSIKTLNL